VVLGRCLFCQSCHSEQSLCPILTFLLCGVYIKLIKTSLFSCQKNKEFKEQTFFSRQRMLMPDFTDHTFLAQTCSSFKRTHPKYDFSYDQHASLLTSNANSVSSVLPFQNSQEGHRGVLQVTIRFVYINSFPHYFAYLTRLSYFLLKTVCGLFVFRLLSI